MFQSLNVADRTSLDNALKIYDEIIVNDDAVIQAAEAHEAAPTDETWQRYETLSFERDEAAEAKREAAQACEAAHREYVVAEERARMEQLTALDALEKTNRDRIVAAGVKPTHYKEYLLSVKDTDGGIEYDMPAINAAHLGSDFNLATDKLMTANKKVRSDRDRHFAGESMDNPGALVSYLVKSLGAGAAKIIKDQLGDEFLKLMPKKDAASINGDNLDAMVMHCNRKMPPVKSCNQKMYVYENGKYHAVSDHDFDVMIGDSFKDVKVEYGPENNPKQGLSSRMVSEIRSTYCRTTDSQRCPEEIVLFRNGYLMDGQFHASDPKIFAIGGPDCKYTPGAACPQWMSFLDHQWKSDPDSIKLLQELMGWFLVDDISFQVLTALYGPTRSGKGTIIRLLNKLVGDEFTSTFRVGTIASSFGCAGMIGKTLAMCGDARGPWDIRVRSEARETLLQISGGDALPVNRKFKEAEDVTIRARIVMAFNDVGDLTTLLMDGHGATSARIRALKFTQSFAGREDTDLDTKLTAELPGIALWALEGLKRLRKQGFTMNDATLNLRAQMKMTPVAEFLKDAEVKWPISSTTLYDMYRAWCKEQGIDRPAVQKFFCAQVVDTASVEYMSSQRRCAHPGCQMRSRFFHTKANTVHEALHQNEGFMCGEHDTLNETFVYPKEDQRNF